MKIKASQLNVDREHETRATLKFAGDDGAPQELDVTLVFRGRSAAQGRRFRELIGKADSYEYVDFLAVYLVRIPELAGDDGLPVTITRELLETWSVENIAVMHAAIEEVFHPNPSPPPVSPAG